MVGHALACPGKIVPAPMKRLALVVACCIRRCRFPGGQNSGAVALETRHGGKPRLVGARGSNALSAFRRSCSSIAFAPKSASSARSSAARHSAARICSCKSASRSVRIPLPPGAATTWRSLRSGSHGPPAGKHVHPVNHWVVLTRECESSKAENAGWQRFLPAGNGGKIVGECFSARFEQTYC
jgi:hypothetical protein